MAYTEDFLQTKLNLGVNLRGYTGSVTMQEGEASDSLDCLPRDDGGYHKSFGYDRINNSALTGRPIGLIGFTYRGKNNTVTGASDTARAGNLTLADDGADFTRRTDEFTSALVLTTSTAYMWNPSTEAFDSVSLPGGVSVDPSPKPSMVVFKENVYVVGWADANLRYDPTDRAFYLWGWASAPSALTATTSSGGDLVADARYRYAYTWFDLYTGEESTLGTITSVTPTGGSLTVDLTVAAYAGSRHFNDLAVATDSDVGVVIYRTNEDDDTYYFLTTLNPGTTTFSDTAPSGVDTALQPFRGTMQDEPRFSALQEFKGRLYALSTKTNSNRLYYSSFTTAPFVERWEVRAFRDLPVPEGDPLKAIGKTDSTMLIYTRKGAFRASVVEGTSTPQIIHVRLPWEVGCVGPRARLTIRGWEYFVSDRGPYRWREGLVDPQWISENQSPMFTDPVSTVCRLSEAQREQTEVGFEWHSDTARFVFAIDGATRPNTHLAYDINAQERLGDYRLGWWPQSPQIQTMDQTVAIGPLDKDGKPPNGSTKQERLVWGDADGYIYEYDLSCTRAGLSYGERATGTVLSSTATVITIPTGADQNQIQLKTAGDGLTGLRLEVKRANGTTMSRRISSNTASTITVSPDFELPIPVADDTWYVAGIPSYWRSWYDHFGAPQNHKTLMHLYIGFLKTTTVGSLAALDVNVGGGDFPLTFSRYKSVPLSKYRTKMLISMTKRFFMYEVANSRPDEMFAITHLLREVKAIAEKRAI